MIRSLLDVTTFRAGGWVEVRSQAEILATLDERGSLEGLPFMPEMLQFCGKRFRIGATAHKTCDTIKQYTARRMDRTVHLEGLRCDGAAHSGCQAGCLLFWKHDWLKRVAGPQGEARAAAAPVAPGRGCDADALARATRRPDPENPSAEPLYVCQATEMLKATAPLAWWDPRQYLLDLVSGNVGLIRWARYTAQAAMNFLIRLRWPWRQIPRVEGKAVGVTPSESLGLNPGEWVQVRSREEIMQTLSPAQKNRGLFFDVEMLPFCDKRYKVLGRVDRIVDEKTGKLIKLPGGCLVLDGVACSGNYSRDRLFCPRAIYPYWREIWLRRVD